MEHDLSRIRLRRNPRFARPSAAVARVGAWPRSRRFPARVVNFSQTGALVELPEDAPRAPGTRLRLRWTVPEGTECATRRRGVLQLATIVRRAAPGEPEGAVGIRFDRTVSESVFDRGDWARKSVALLGAAAAGVFIISIKAENLYWFWHSPFIHAYSLVASTFVLTRLLVSLLYKLPRDNHHFPTVSVCITAKNEEECIAETIEACYASRYPRELFEVIAVDDGSTDRTWERMSALKEKFGDNLTLIQFEKNRGKRHAMAAGAMKAKGEIILYVDSDTFAHPEAMYRMMQPFVDPKVGAVAGHILVNIKDNYISKMESVRYYVSHRVNKAGEGVFGCVTCCSGAFSAYRRSAVLEVLDDWLGQKFLGVQATFGDDRSLTNYVLKGYRVLYHDAARSRTNVPEYWMKFFKQQLRWKKSWSRETLVAVRFMWREHPVAAVQYYLGVVLTLLSPFIVINSVILNPLLRGGSGFHYLAGLVLTYAFMTLICLYHTRTRYWAYGLTFAVLYIFVFSWQNYYAMMTINKTKWGTR